MKPLSHGQLFTILVLLLFSHLFVFTRGYKHGTRRSEDAGELAFEAAAQQYKNAYGNDTTRKFDYYGNPVNQEEEATQFVLQKNARTKAINPKKPLYPETEPLRTKNQAD